MGSGIVAALLVLTATSALAETNAAGDAAPLQVVVRGDRVTATLKGVDVGRVVAEIARQTGAEIRGEAIPRRETTLELHHVAVDEAMQRLLGTRSFTLTYTREGHLKRITIGGGPGAAPVHEATAMERPADPQANVDPADGRQRLQDFGGSTIPIRGRLANALGADAATFKDIWDAALRHADPRVRAAARRAALQSIAGDPEVHTAWVNSTLALPDSALVTLVRAMAGLDAEALVIATARYGRSVEVSRTMRRVLEQLRAQPVAPTNG